MKCPDCVKENKKSSIQIGMTTSTCMYFPPFYDEEGEFHSHDSNGTSTSYHCSNGHSFNEHRTNSCPNPKCDWGKKK